MPTPVHLLTNPKPDKREDTFVVALNGVVQNDILIPIGDGRGIEVLDVTFTPLQTMTLPGAGTATITVGILANAITGTPTRRATWRLDTANTTMNLTASRTNALRVSTDAVIETNPVTVTTDLAITGNALPVGALPWVSNRAGQTASKIAYAECPACVTVDYTPSAAADETGGVEVRVLWQYADTGREI